ncbi:MAG: 2OG-Fe(II) oxygenase [Sphingomonas sp.]|nr:2OG-Fe(II) oxygenase [Sphingomonas sp.]
MSAELISQAEQLFAEGQAPQAMAMLGEAARANDPDALNYLADITVKGKIVHRDLPLARDLYRRAAAAGSEMAAAAYRAFVANGTGGPANWNEAMALLRRAAEAGGQAAREWSIIQSMSLREDGRPASTPEGQEISRSPDAWAFKGIFSDAECDFLVDAARPRFAPSTVVDPKTGELVSNPVRTSEAASFGRIAESPAIHALCLRLAAASATDVRQGEPLQVLRYSPGQEYRPHFDAIEGAANQRTITFLVYLNDDYAGGATRFEASGLEFRGAKGDGLMFRNALATGEPDLRSQHSGMPVTEGEKLVASRWIRERALDL